jgi:hypothetical protein
MIEVKVTSNIEQLSRALREVGEKQLPKTMARAATRTAWVVRERIIEAITKDFDRPTPLTLKSLYVKAAKPGGAPARVWFKDAFTSGIPADKYLQPQVQGGPRGHKRFEKALIARGLMSSSEYAIPTKDVLNAFGNVPGGLSMRILSGLGAAETVAGVTANASSSRRSRKKGNKARFFIAKIKNTRAIWEQKTTALGRGIRPVFVFVTKAPSYSSKLDFRGIAERTIEREYLAQFSAAIDEAIVWAMEKKT